MQEHVCNGAAVLVAAVGLKRDFLAKHEGGSSLFLLVTEGLTFLRAVDAVQAYTFSAGVVKDFDVVAVEDGDDGAGETRKCCGCEKDQCD